MNGVWLAIFAIILLALGGVRSGDVEALAPQSESVVDSPRFMAVDVFVDPHGKPLAAYQVQVVASGGNVTLVGVEGGEHPAFAVAPYYDKRAILNQRIVIAAFNTIHVLPTNKTRVATLMVRVSGGATPTFAATLQTAASADARPMAADVSVSIAPPALGAK